MIDVIMEAVIEDKQNQIKMTFIYRHLPIADDTALFEFGHRFRARNEKGRWGRKIDFMSPSFIELRSDL